jgi:hypothetical protein
MPIKGKGITLSYTAYDNVNQVGITGDVANHTLRLIIDGVSTVPTNSPAEVDATNAPGKYKLALTDAEMICETLELAGKSSTASVDIIGPTLVTELGHLERNAFLTETQRGAHTYQGNHFYVDPVNGDTHANGNRGSRWDPYSLVQDCHDNAVTDSNHDVVFLVSGASGGPTTLTESVTLTKRYTFYRGPGRDFIWTRTGSGNTIQIQGDGIEIFGCQINTGTTGTGDGIAITNCDFTRIARCWINDTRGHAISAVNADNMVICENYLQGSGQSGAGHGITIDGGAGTCNYGRIHDNWCQDVQGDGIRIAGNADKVVIHDNRLHECTGWGINIGSGATATGVGRNGYGGNGSGDFQDNGTDTYRGHDGLGRDADFYSETIWNEVLLKSTYDIPNSAGRRLRQFTSQIITSGLVISSTLNTVTLNGDASAVDGAYDPGMITIIEGTGAGQSRMILEYVGATKTTILDRDWKVQPDVTSEYVIFAWPGREHINEGLAQAGTANTITLNALASDDDNAYVGQVVFIRSGTGEDQARRVTAYNGTTKVATMDANWAHIPDATSAYVMLPTASFDPVALAGIFLNNGLAKEATSQQILANIAPAGANQVTVTIQEADTTPIPDVTVTLLNDAETIILQILTTDVNGQFVTALDDGTYKVRLRKSNFVFTVPETLTVSGATTDTYTGTGFAITPPPTPDLITLYANVYDLGIAGVSGLTVNVKPEPAPTIISDTIISDTIETTTTDGNGYFELTLAKGALIRVEIGTFFSKVVELPTTGTDVNLATLLDQN